MLDQDKLALNEALISVNKTSITSPIEIYFQKEECFGCPLEKLAEVRDPVEIFKVSTRYNLQLELRHAGSSNTSVSCHFDNLALNSHGHYLFEVVEQSTATASRHLACSFATVSKGDCLLCPLAILVFILFVFMLLEWISTRLFKTKNRELLRSAGSSSSSEDVSAASMPGVVSPQQDSVMMSGASRENSPTQRQTQTQAQTQHEQEHVKTNDAAQCSLAAFKTKRIDCLDAFRGLTIAGMIFVNYGGAGYAIWEHKPWNGITLADFVFPFFIFSMGSSIAISIRFQMKTEISKKRSLFIVATKIIRRSLILMILGICLNAKWLDYDDGTGFTKLRVTGVLQRFAISYLIVALMYATELTLNRWIKAQSLSQVPCLARFVVVILELLLAFKYLAIYVYVTFFLEFSPECPIGYTGPGGQTDGAKYANCTGGAARWLDQLVLGQSHMYNDTGLKEVFKTHLTHDPEGILGHTTSILLTLIGLQCGKILARRQSEISGLGSTKGANHSARLVAMAQWTAMLALACSLAVVIPINKRLWSLSFVVLTSLAAFVITIVLYVFLDVYKIRRSFVLQLLISAGKNPIFLYVGHSLIQHMPPWWFPISDPSSHLQLLLRLFWATLMWLMVSYYMDRKSLYIRV